MSEILVEGRCTNCGAVILRDGDHNVCSPSFADLKRRTGLNVNPRERKKLPTFIMCDRCVNHWALDMCSCGSGKKVGKCKCGSRHPSMVLGGKLPDPFAWARERISEHV